MCEMKNAYKNLLGKPECKRMLGKSRHIWKNKIKRELSRV
jgi:hypothetical protein